MKKQIINASLLGTAAALWRMKEAECSGGQSTFRSAVTFNPMFEKRYKQGEDSFVSMPALICVCDGVGGWIRKLVETGNFSREFAVNIQMLYVTN